MSTANDAGRGAGVAARLPYHRQHVRALRDMHIPDWEPTFMTALDPEATASRYADTGVGGVLLYAKSHTGLCNFPTRVGRMHRGLGGRDFLGETHDALRARGVATAVYTSVTYDNEAAQRHPTWRQIDLRLGGDTHEVSRYGLVCPNNSDYRDYELALLEEILRHRDWDALFLDMVFFATVCVCASCTRRFRDEVGGALPHVVDWTDRRWCSFQQARERWIEDWAATLIDRAKHVAPDTAVTLNQSASFMGWRLACPLSTSALVDFTSGDLSGPVDQLWMNRLHLHLNPGQPGEFMTTTCSDLHDHVGLRSESALVAAGLAAVATGNAFLLIDAIDPVGTAPGGADTRLAGTVTRLGPFVGLVGGRPVEDVAVYFSDASGMDHADNGIPVPAPHSPREWRQTPHVRAVQGACLALQRAHLPFGAITLRQLDQLDQFRVLVVPELSRIREEEVAAFRSFVQRGGRLYVSGYTSMVGIDGTVHDNFLLADVFGADFAGEELAGQLYLRPLSHDLRMAVAPQSYISQPAARQHARLCGTPRVRLATGTAAAALTLPYGHPHPGTAADRMWASIHASPPWQDTDEPVLVSNRFGDGQVVYSTFSLESSPTPANTRLFVAVVEQLLDGRSTMRVEAHPDVWVSAFDQPENGRVVVTLLHHSPESPAPVSRASVTLSAPGRSGFVRIAAVPEGRLRSEGIVNGTVEVEVEVVDGLTVLVADYL